MEIDDLRRLLALSSHGRVTDAAAALRIPQPTLSRTLARAEAELGARLFARGPRGVRPNPHGDLVLAAARDLVERYDRMCADLAGGLDPDTGTVRLAFLDSMATSLVPRILHDFRARAPGVRVELIQEPGHEMLRDLGNGTVDLAVTSPRLQGPHGWVALQRQRLLAVVPAVHRLATGSRVALADLADEDFVTVPAGFGFRTLVDELFSAAGSAPRVAFESQDLATIAGLVGAGLGVALLPEQFAGTPGTTSLPLSGQSAAARAERTVGLAWRTDRALVPPAARLLEFLRDAAPYP